MSCGDNAGGNKSIFSTKEAESGVYSTKPENVYGTDEEEHSETDSKDSTKIHSSDSENKTEKLDKAKDSTEVEKENKWNWILVYSFYIQFSL